MINLRRDGHIHSHYCPHGSNDNIEKYVQEAINIGLEEITFTEHLPLPNEFKDPSPKKDSAMREEDVLSYIEDIKYLKEKYKSLLKINIGFEIDYIEGYENDIKENLNKYGLDIEDAILSVHMIKIGNDYYCIDYSVEEFKKIFKLLGTIEKVYTKYYETVILALNSDLGEYKPKRIGHLNLVRKFNKIFPYDYSKSILLEDIVKLIKDKNYEIDYNISGRIKDQCLESYISGYLLNLVKKYDIPMVLGSDSHNVKYIKKYDLME
ncbi:MAG: histidinol-phosphatase HisJ [Romboutsia sp.]